MFANQGQGYDSIEEGIVKVPLGIYEIDDGEDVFKVAKIGTVRRLADRLFVYSKAGGSNLAQGKMMVQATPAANHQNVAVQAAVAIGENKVTVTLGATLASLNQYEDGYLTISDGTGEGTIYKIKSNPAADSGATLELTLYDTIHEALDTTSECCLTPNPFNGTVICTAANPTTEIPAGVPLNAVTATNYYWSCVRGVCPVFADEDVVVGKDLTLGTSVDGCVELADAAGEVILGRTIMAIVDDEYRPVYLTIM